MSVVTTRLRCDGCGTEEDGDRVPGWRALRWSHGPAGRTFGQASMGSSPIGTWHACSPACAGTVTAECLEEEREFCRRMSETLEQNHRQNEVLVPGYRTKVLTAEERWKLGWDL